ncbi:MAG: hypothetical protein MMC23_002696 [Stictis urceolatum]|nr:hypothetical protein [Stictis urceolata]
MAFANDYSMPADMQIDLPEWLQQYASSSSPSSDEWFNSPIEPSLDRDLDLDMDINLLDPSLTSFDTNIEPQQSEYQAIDPTTAPTPSGSSSGPSIHSSISCTPSHPHSSQPQTGPFTCTHPLCLCSRTFKRASELNKHIARIIRPFACNACTTRPFSTRHDLARHRREVHKEDDTGKKVDSLACPVKLCKRNRRGFGRRENLVSHVRRVHGEGVLSECGDGEEGRGKGEFVEGSRSACGELEGRVEKLLREREGLLGRAVEIDAQVEALRMSIGLLRG